MELNRITQIFTKETCIIVILMIIFCYNLDAQISKKTINLGGDFNYTSRTQEEEKLHSYSLNASIGYFIIDNLSIGANLDYANNKWGEYKNSSIGFGPMIRFYMDSLLVKPFLHFSYLGTFVGLSDAGIQEFVSRLRPAFGLSYLLTPSVALETVISYTISYTTREFAEQPLDKYLSLNIGFQVFLPPK